MTPQKNMHEINRQEGLSVRSLCSFFRPFLLKGSPIMSCLICHYETVFDHLRKLIWNLHCWQGYVLVARYLLHCFVLLNKCPMLWLVPLPWDIWASTTSGCRFYSGQKIFIEVEFMHLSFHFQNLSSDFNAFTRNRDNPCLESEVTGFIVNKDAK